MNIYEMFRKKDPADDRIQGERTQKLPRPKFTPERINKLFDDEIFVFGSNLAGRHGGGAARIAKNYFGAVSGQGVGLQGQSYAIPTMQGGVETIKPYVDEFIEFASVHTELFFYVTRIGCGIAGFKDEDIAPLFRKAVQKKNICLPKSFFFFLIRNGYADEFPEITCSTAIRLSQQGQIRTLADIAMALNDQKHFSNVDYFMASFDETIKQYKERGTVSHQVCDAVGNIIRENEKTLFTNNGYLDFDTFIKLVDGLVYDNDNSLLHAIYSRREKTKMLRLAMILNDIMHYTDADELFSDLYSIASGRFNCGDNRYMNDSFHYPLFFFKRGVMYQWKEIQKNGYMNNDLLEEKMFTEHERKISFKGLSKVLEEDFVTDSICHPEVLVPKQLGTAPIYVKDEFYTDHCSGEPMYVKSCGEGKGPNAHHTYYEMNLVKHILQRECTRGEYKEVDEFYIPVYDDSKPIFHKLHGLMEFDMGADKDDLLRDLRYKKER